MSKSSMVLRLRRTVAVAAVALSAALFVPGQLSAAPEGETAIKERVGLMKNDVVKPYGKIKDYVQKGEGTPDEVATHAKALSEAAAKITPLFPAGTGRGDFNDKTTRALPEIWTDWPRFEAAADALEVEAARLVEVAEGGDKDAIAAQFALIGKNGCGACHKPFRGPKAE